MSNPETAPSSLPDSRLLRLDPRDNVLCLVRPMEPGETLEVAGRRARVEQALGRGAKLAAEPIPAGAPVVKYGQPIGVATRDIGPGDLVHVHNLRSNYLPTYLHQTQSAYFQQ